jgi:PST family polysaccharide transporter
MLHKESIKKRYLEYKLLIQNFSYLGLLQIFSLLFPMITFPYLIRTLGKEIYGLIVYSQTIIGYFVIVINFGFNISATKDISVNRNDKNKLDEIVSSVLIIKVLLCIISFIVLALLVLWINELKKYYILYFLTMGLALFEAIFPVWYFQGIEDMKYITVINIISRGIYTILIFVVVKSSTDYLLVPLLSGIGLLVGGIVSLYIIFQKKGIKFSFQKKQTVFHYFNDSLPFFFSRATSVIISKTNTLLIGSYLNYTTVAYYDFGLKISEICKIPSNILNQTVYPSVSKSKDMNFVVKITKLSLFLSILSYLFVLIFDHFIINVLGGKQMLPSKYLIHIINLTTPIAGISYFLGNTMLVVMGYFKKFNLSVIYESIFYIILTLALIMTNNVGPYYLAVVIVLSSIYEMGYRYYYTKKYRIL